MNHPKKLILFIFFLAACGPQKADQPDTPFENARDNFFNNLVPPAELAVRLQSSSAEYDPSLINDARVWGSYATDEVKAAANLGVYLSDLNYCVAFGKTETTKDLFTAAHGLSATVGIEKSVLDFLLQRYHDNLTENDTAAAIIGTLYLRASQDLKGTKREKLAGIAMSAYQVENLHLALGLLNAVPGDSVPDEHLVLPLTRMVLDQKRNIEIIYHFLRSVSDVTEPGNNPNYPYYANAFEELIGVYDRLNIDSMLATARVVSDVQNNPAVKELTEKVEAIRNKVVSVQPN